MKRTAEFTRRLKAELSQTEHLNVYNVPCPECGASVVATAKIKDDQVALSRCSAGHEFTRARAFAAYNASVRAQLRINAACRLLAVSVDKGIYPEHLAYHRLEAMRITKGDNFRQGARDAELYLTNIPCADFELLQKHENHLLLLSKLSGASVYLLVRCDLKRTDDVLSELKKGSHSLKAVGVQAVEAFIELFGPVVNTVWVAKSLQGRGYGKALYKTAYNYSMKGIESSQALGTMSLAVWISLMKENKSIYLDVGRFGKAKLTDLVIYPDDLEIIWRDKDLILTSDRGPDFSFRWPK